VRVSAGWGSLLGELTAFATVVALSPFSVIPAIALVVHSERPKPTGLAFIVGWLTGKAALTVLFVQAPRLLDGLDQPAPHWTAWGEWPQASSASPRASGTGANLPVQSGHRDG
jgi:hypothetical protein